jgi:MFS transporter, FSR family, fosmidomycin resistance protein
MIIRTLLCLALAHFLVDFMIGIWAIYKTLAYLDLFLAGIISGLGAFFGEGMQIFFGPWSDRGWRKHLICAGVLIAGASVFLGYFTNYWMFLLLYVATCLGSGAFHPSAVSLAGALTPHRKALMIGIFAAGGSFGLASSQMVFSHLHTTLEGHTAILIVPTVILTLILLFFGLKDIHHFTPKHSTKEVNLKALFGMFKIRNLRLLYIAQICNQTIFWAMIFFLPDTLVCKGYDTWICHGGGHLFLILGGAMMMIPSGYLSDRYSPKSVLLVSTFGAMLIFYTFLFYPPLDNIAFFAMIFTLGAFLATINPVIIAFGNTLAPENPGMVSAFLMGMAWCVSEGLGQSGGGVISKFFDEHAPVYTLGVIGIFFIFGLIATFLLPGAKKDEVGTQIA